MSFEDILRSLPQLTNAQLEQVLSRVKALQTLSSSATDPSQLPDVPTSTLEDTILDVVQDVCVSKGLARVRRDVLRRNVGSFKDKAIAIDHFIESARLSRTQKHAFLSLAMGLLYDNLQDMNVPVSSRMLVTHMHRIPEIINKHFPGYAKAGLLRLIVRDRTKVKA